MHSTPSPSITLLEIYPYLLSVTHIDYICQIVNMSYIKIKQLVKLVRDAHLGIFKSIHPCGIVHLGTFFEVEK